MEKTTGNATIFDVAKLCGVSRGTVDRVVHRRGRVSQATIDKVNRAIEILGYKPNANASLLASKKVFTFSCLMPKFNKGEYWEKIYEGFLSAVAANPQFKIDLDLQFYDQTDPESFKKCCDDVLKRKPAGVVLTAVFPNEVSEFARKLDEAKIPYAFEDNKVDNLNYLFYYGADPYKSGTMAAFLLTNRINPPEIAIVRLIRDIERKADPNSIRRKGFIDYINRTQPSCKVHQIFIKPSEPHESYMTLKAFFDKHPNVKHIAMINSRVYLLADFLNNNPDPQRVVIGFDDLERNLASLRSGAVEYLVTRQISMQSYHALTALAEYVILGKMPAKRENYLHMEILHRLNLDD